MTGLISTYYHSVFKNMPLPFFLPLSLYRRAAHGHVFCMPSRYNQKGMVAFHRSSVQLKALVYLAFVSSLYVAVFLFGAVLG